MIEDDTFYIWVEEYIVSKISSGKGIKLEEQFLFVFNRIEQTKHRVVLIGNFVSMYIEPNRIKYSVSENGPNN